MANWVESCQELEYIGGESGTNFGTMEIIRDSDNSNFSGGSGSFIVVNGGEKRR